MFKCSCHVFLFTPVEGALMEDMVKKIVEIDEHARKLNADTEKEILDSVNKIQKLKEELFYEYSHKAKEKLEIARQEEQEAAVNAMKEVDRKYRDDMRNMEMNYRNNGDNWVEAIFNRVIKG